MADTLLGTAYVTSAEFSARALAFGCNSKALTAISALTTQLDAVLAAASRAVDNFLSRDPGSFSGATIYENHKWNPATRRVTVNQPPVSSLKSYVIRISPSLTAPFPVTPVSTDAGSNQVAFGSIYYNRQENFLELASFALAGSLTNNLAGLGMTEFSVEIGYTSYANVQPEIAAATIQTATEAVNTYYLNQLLLPGLSKSGQGALNIERVVIPQQELTNLTNAILSPAAARYLAKLSRIAIG